MASSLSFELRILSSGASGIDSVDPDLSVNPELSETLTPEGAGTPRKIFSCKRCSYSTDRKNNLKRHMAAMHEISAQRLECCGIRFFSKADIKVHNAKFHSEGYKCPMCGQHFVRKALLERHFSVHTGEKKFACECGYRTSHKSNLERHYKTHLKDLSCLGPQSQDKADLEKRKSNFSSQVKDFQPGSRQINTMPPFSRSGMMTYPSVHRISSVPFSDPRKSAYPSLTRTLERNGSSDSEESTIAQINEPRLCTAGRQDSSRRGFTVEDILHSDVGNKRATSSKTKTEREDSSLSHILRPTAPAKQSKIWYQSRPSMGASTSEASFRSPKVIRPFPLYRGFTPTLTLPYSSTSLTTNVPSVPRILPENPSKNISTSISSGLSSTSLSNLSLPMENSVSFTHSSSFLPVYHRRSLFPTRSSFSIGDILKRDDSCGSKHDEHSSQNSLEPPLRSNLSNGGKNNSGIDFIHTSLHKERLISDHERLTAASLEYGRKDTNLSEVRFDGFTTKPVGEMGKLKGFNHERGQEQRKMSPDEDNEVQTENHEGYFLRENSKPLEQKYKLFPRKKFPCSANHFDGQNLENRLDFTHYIHKKWRVRNSL